jgi:hypothetical protein
VRDGVRPARHALRGWYVHGLHSKLARAVAEGRVDAGRADELHRLMTQLLGDPARTRPGR